MVGIGIGEMILIAGIALVVFGPEKFPDFAKIVLRTVRDLRGYVDEIQSEIQKEIKPIKREIDQLNKYDPKKYVDSLAKDVNDSTKKKTPAKATATKSKGAADPTDRQDDSFDYDDGSGDYNYNKHEQQDYDTGADIAQDTATDSTAQPSEPDSASSGDSPSGGAAADSKPQPSEPDSAAQGDAPPGDANKQPASDNKEKDDFDFSKPPVERLD